MAARPGLGAIMLFILSLPSVSAVLRDSASDAAIHFSPAPGSPVVCADESATGADFIPQPLQEMCPTKKLAFHNLGLLSCAQSLQILWMLNYQPPAWPAGDNYTDLQLSAGYGVMT